MADDKQTLIIRDVPKKVAQRLETIAKAEGYSSRNALLIEVLIQYAESRSRAFYNTLPGIVKEMCRQELSGYKQEMAAASEIATRNFSLSALQLLKIAQWFEEYIMTDLQAQGAEALSSLIDDFETNKVASDGG